MRSIVLLFTYFSLGLGSIFSWVYIPSVRAKVEDLISSGTFQTLEVRYSAEAIMEARRKDLLKDGEHVYLEPILKFVPYLLMEVKYNRTRDKTGEGVILWGLVDGEMVISTNTWEKTHGFEDALTAGATNNDFKILNALAKNKGIMTLQQLQKSLHLELEIITPWITSAVRKNLVVQHGNELQLHFQNPKILVSPHTHMNEWTVTKPYSQANRVGRNYSKSQIEKTAQAAFGQGFTIRSTREVFLPVFSIETVNPDGSILTSFWNALNGRRIRNGRG